MTALLVSVRSGEEALVALEGGASIIDVKEPSRGSLGRADDAVIREVVRVVAGRRPVSAALGEWADGDQSIPEADLTFVKWGLAGCRRSLDWRAARSGQNGSGPRHVLVAYADWECAMAPSVEEVFSVAAVCPGSVMLVDTYCKDATNVVHKVRPTLLDWMQLESIVHLCDRARAAQVKIALAGSLGGAEVTELLPARPDWFAVRGAVCDAADRRAGVQLELVLRFVNLLKHAS